MSLSYWRKLINYERGFEGMLFFNWVFEALEEHMEKAYKKMEKENREQKIKTS